MGWESSVVDRFDLGAPPSRSNGGSLALVSCLSGGYKFATVLRCVGLIVPAGWGFCLARLAVSCFYIVDMKSPEDDL